jgi:hypothetical protein
VQVSQFNLKTGGDSLSVVWPQNHYYGLVIWTSKSPRQFLGLGLKTKGRRFVSLCLKNRWVDDDGARTHVDMQQLASVRSKSC